MADRVLSKEQEVDVDVNAEDQKMINEFGRWNAKKKELFNTKKVLETDRENADEAKDELCLAEGDTVRIHVGDAFIAVPTDVAEERLEKRIESLDAELERVSEQLASLTDQMNKHKAILKAKFKDSINLDDTTAEE